MCMSRKIYAAIALMNIYVLTLSSQTSDRDSIQESMNMDAVYDRPFLTFDKFPVNLGGYLEANSIYSIEDGLSEGLSFQARRLTLFVSASISKRIKFLTELEFENGTEEIAIEFASMDIALHPLLNLRGGIILNPIGSFNQNHDGPKWEFVERPDVSTNLLPATFSNAGFGIYGKAYKGAWTLGYEAYLTDGFDTSIIDNVEERTFLAAVKENSSRFEENFSGNPLLTGKFAIKHRKLGELGISYMGGTYNRQEVDGLQVDTKSRSVDVLALDLNTAIKKTGTRFIGEMAYIWVDVPDTFTQQFGNRQVGFFVDIVQPVLKTEVLDWEDAVLNLSLRTDYVDYNIGRFAQTNTNIGDDLFAITPALSFRPTPQTVLRINYRYQWQQDILNNPASRTATWYFGFSTYF
mgnify:FL=1